MELQLLIDILKLVVPTIIALASLTYAMKQRNLVKKEILKKRYLENALSNLDDAVKSLKVIEDEVVRPIQEKSDEWIEGVGVTYDILRANFDLKKSEVSLRASYVLNDFGERSKSLNEVESRQYRNFDNIEPRWVADLFRKDKAILIESETEIDDFQQELNNSISIYTPERGLSCLVKAEKRLTAFEGVYDTLSPNITKKVTQLFEEITSSVLETISHSKHLKIDLTKFEKTEGITNYLYEEIARYSYINEKFSKVSEIVAELNQIRKELFLKIS